jgi:hypothetical protein
MRTQKTVSIAESHSLHFGENITAVSSALERVDLFG